MATDTQNDTQHPPAATAERREAELRRWERMRAQGRTHFLWRNGVLGWGLPAALLTAVYKVIQEQGLVLSPTLFDGDVAVDTGADGTLTLTRGDVKAVLAPAS